MIIEMRDVGKRFAGHQAVHGLSLSVPEGSAFALVGANGAGKTTAIRILMNILAPTSGDATVLGVDSRRLTTRERAQIGYVSENQHLPSRMTVGGYLDYLRPFYPTWDNQLEATLLGQLQLPAERTIGALSHGMRMKMLLACALPFRPKVLILDEPFSGLDPLMRDELMEGLIRQAGEMTIFISSHELTEIEGFVTHLGFIDSGKLLFQEVLVDLNERMREVRLTLSRPAPTAAVYPPEWLDIRAVGNVLTFVDTKFSEEDSIARLSSLFSDIRGVTVERMPLRQIFTTFARAAQRREALA